MIYARDVHGRALCHAGQTDRSYAEMTQALEDARRVLGPTSPLVGQISVNRVTCGRRLGYLRESLEDNTRGIEIRAASMERDSRGWGNTHLSRGMTLLALRRPHAALADLAPAVDSLERSVGRTHRFTLTARLMRMVALGTSAGPRRRWPRPLRWGRCPRRSTRAFPTTPSRGRCTASRDARWRHSRRSSEPSIAFPTTPSSGGT